MINLDSLISGATEMEPLPASTSRLAQLIARTDWDLDEIVDVIQLDLSLTGKLLGMANSVLSGAAEPIRTVQQAVGRMGSGTVLSLAVGSCVQQQLQQPLPLYGIDEGGLWRHSVASALAAENAACYCSAPVPPETYAAALLHDVGKLVMQRHLGPTEVRALRRLREDTGLSWVDAEEEALSINHAKIGQLVARSWCLPDGIADAVGGHHRPELVEGRRGRLVSSVVSLADLVAKSVDSDREGTPPIEYASTLCDDLGMTQAGLASLCADVDERLGEVLGLYGDERAAA